LPLMGRQLVIMYKLVKRRTEVPLRGRTRLIAPQLTTTLY